MLNSLELVLIVVITGLSVASAGWASRLAGRFGFRSLPESTTTSEQAVRGNSPRRFWWTEVGGAVGVALAVVAVRTWNQWQAGGADASWSDTWSTVWGKLMSPKEARDFLPWGALAASCGIVLDRAVFHRWRGAGLVAAGLWGAGIAALLLLIWRGSIYTVDGQLRSDMYGHLATAAGIVALGSFIFSAGRRCQHPGTAGEIRATHLGGVLSRWGITLGFIAAAIVTMTSGSLNFGVLVLAGAAAAGHVALLGTVSRHGRQDVPTGGWWLFWLVASLALGVYFAEVTWLNALLIAGGTAVWGCCAAALARGSHKIWILVWALVALSCHAAATAGAIRQFQIDMEVQANDPYSAAYGG